MPVQFPIKRYASLADFYYSTQEQDPITFDIITVWHYDDPDTKECLVEVLLPEDALEKFGEVYSDKEFVRIEMSVADSKSVDKDFRVGNLRMRHDESVTYYDNYEGQTVNRYVFNIGGISPVLDMNGRPVAVEIFCDLAEVVEWD